VLLLRCLVPQDGLAGRSRHEAQEQRRPLGWGSQDPAEGHPPVQPVDIAPSLNWARSNAQTRRTRILPFARLAFIITQPKGNGVYDAANYTHATNGKSLEKNQKFIKW